MNGKKRGDNQQDSPERYLRQVDDTYVFDEASGLYKPIRRRKEKEITHQGQVEINPNLIQTETRVQRDWLDFFLKALGFLISLFTLVLLIFTVCYARKQWKEAKRTADASICAAKAAASEAKTAREAFVTQNRPWLSLKNITCDVCTDISGGSGPPGANLRGTATITGLKAEIANSGRTPAKNVIIDFTIHWGTVSEFPGTGNCKEMKIGQPACFPSRYDTRNFVSSGDYSVSQLQRHPIYMGIVAPDSQNGILLVGGPAGRIVPLPNAANFASVYVDGTITYESTLGTEVNGFTKFCFYPTLSYGDPNGKRDEQYTNCDNPNSSLMK